jgi:pimeloyl-ACP methyl ester carboxylesterase
VLSSVPPVEPITATRERIGIKKFDLGVLLVHGLGDQQRGDTLTEAGDEIFRWLRQRVEKGEHKGTVTLLEVVSRPASPKGDAIPAAHGAVRIEPPEGAEKAAYWVIAEAWWAEVFRPATFNEIAGWCVTVGPWVFATQVAGIRRRLEIARRVPLPLRLALIPVTLVFGFAMFFGAAILGFLVTVLAVAVFILSVIPIPFLSDVARGFQRQLANGFGDAYVLTRSPVRFGAMASSVRSDLKVLREECRNVVLVGHSQGTAVAWKALLLELTETPTDAPGEGEGKASAPIRLFLTYGQAVRKLTFALTMAEEEEEWGRRAGLGLLSAAFIGLAVALYFLTEDWPLRILPLISLALAGLAEGKLLREASKVWDTAGATIERHWAEVVQKAKDIEWLDLWASADPASVGALDVRGHNVRSYKIRNLGSILGDHTVYWRNTTEFLAIVSGKLFAIGGPEVYAVDLRDRELVIAAMRRHARVVALTTMRFIVLGAVLAALASVLLTRDLGTALIEFVDGLSLPFIGDFFADPPQWAPYVASALPVLVAGYLVWGAAESAWNGLVRGDEMTYIQARRPRFLWSAGWYVLAGFVALVAIGAAALLNASPRPDFVAVYVLATLLLALLGLAVLSSGGRTFAGTEQGERETAAISRISSRTWLQGALVAIPFTILIGLPILAGVAVSAQAAFVVIAVEALVVSVVLALEGLREYRLFRRYFKRRTERATIRTPTELAGKDDD